MRFTPGVRTIGCALMSVYMVIILLYTVLNYFTLQ